MTTKPQFSVTYDQEEEMYHIDPNSTVLNPQTTGDDGDINVLTSDGTAKVEQSAILEDLYYPQFEDASTSVLIGSAVIFFMYILIYTQLNLREYCDSTKWTTLIVLTFYSGCFTIISLLYCILRWVRYPLHSQRYDRDYNRTQAPLISKTHRIISVMYHSTIIFIHSVFFLLHFVTEVSTRKNQVSDPLYGGTSTNWAIIVAMLILITIFWGAVLFINVGILIRVINRVKYANDYRDHGIEITNYEDVI